MFIGRYSELRELNDRFQKKQSQLVVIYGRRRVGKSSLLEEFSKEKKHLFFEGIEHSPKTVQIQNFLNSLSKQLNDPFISKMKLTSWIEVFDLLTKTLKDTKNKYVVAIDEFQWLACQQSHLVSIFKFYWDNHWKNLNVMFVLCGSIANYMISKVIRSKALYGRISWELCLTGLSPPEIAKMLNKRGAIEILKYLMIFGSIPKYIEEINQNTSFESNINRLCFTKTGFFVDELEKIFYSQFREVQIYKKIISLLSYGNLNLSEIAKKTRIPSGGGLKSYLNNLERSGFIRQYRSINKKGHGSQRYKLFDEFIVFYFKFIKPHLHQIQENEKQKFFNNAVASNWQPWLGIAFETFCLKHAMFIAEQVGFADEVISFGPFFSTKDQRFQIDLIYIRASGIRTVCEIKFHDKPVGTKVIPEFEKKVALLPKIKTTTERMLISPFGADTSLINTEYFQHIVTLDQLFKS